MDPVSARETAVRLAQLERRLEDTQALIARVYERRHEDVDAVARARAAVDYDAAWSELTPLVSVRVSTFRGAELLTERTLPTLLAQTHREWEALVVGDDTDDDTAKRVEALGDSRISFENLPVRGPYPEDPARRWLVAGIPPANRAMQKARGRWVATLDHDDAWDPDHLERLLAVARRTRAEVVYGRLRVVGPEGEGQGEVGAWPPRQGDFNWLGSLVHAGLKDVRFDLNSGLGGEPGDWNLARRLWDAGARFAFLDQVVATYHHERKPGTLTGADAVVEELRGWARELQTALEYWQDRSGGFEKELEERAAYDARQLDDQKEETARSAQRADELHAEVSELRRLRDVEAAELQAARSEAVSLQGRVELLEAHVDFLQRLPWQRFRRG